MATRPGDHDRIESEPFTWGPPPCDCIHDAAQHDPISGACLVTNPTFGPCPCAATPAPTRAALEAVFRFHRSAERLTREQSG